MWFAHSRDFQNPLDTSFYSCNCNQVEILRGKKGAFWLISLSRSVRYMHSELTVMDEPIERVEKALGAYAQADRDSYLRAARSLLAGVSGCLKFVRKN